MTTFKKDDRVVHTITGWKGIVVVPAANGLIGVAFEKEFKTVHESQLQAVQDKVINLTYQNAIALVRIAEATQALFCGAPAALNDLEELVDQTLLDLRGFEANRRIKADLINRRFDEKAAETARSVFKDSGAAS